MFPAGKSITMRVWERIECRIVKRSLYLTLSDEKRSSSKRNVEARNRMMKE